MDHQDILDALADLENAQKLERDARDFSYREKRRKLQEECGRIGHVYGRPALSFLMLEIGERMCVVCLAREPLQTGLNSTNPYAGSRKE